MAGSDAPVTNFDSCGSCPGSCFMKSDTWDQTLKLKTMHSLSNYQAPDEALPTQFILYTDDSVDAEFSDGSKLQLSPCGTSFIHDQPPGESQHPLHGVTRIQQRSRYVTSAFREKLLATIEFRNRFAERPFLCRDLIPQEHILTLHADINQLTWGKNTQAAVIEVLENGAVTVVANEEFGSLTLSPHREDFTVKYLARLSQGIPKFEKDLPNLLHEKLDVDHASPELNPGKVKYAQKRRKEMVECIGGGNYNPGDEHKWDYVWIVQHFSVKQYPKEWSYPLSLVKNKCTDIDRDKFANSTFQQSKHVNCDSGLDQNCIDTVCNNTTELPCTLYLQCKQPNLHKWNDRDGMKTRGRMKVLCNEGVVYRFLSQPCLGVEILPGDGSVIRSQSMTGHFFTHFVLKDGQVQELLYSVQTPPPCTGQSVYDVGKLIGTASRYLHRLVQENMSISTEELCCYKREIATEGKSLGPAVFNGENFVEEFSQHPGFIEPLPVTLLEEAYVGELGHFKAYSNGRIRILFNDRTCLDMMSDFSKRLGNCKKHSPEKVEQMQDPVDYKPVTHRSSRNPSTIPGTCKLLLRNGQYVHASIENPLGYQKYITAAMEWSDWVNTSPSERYLFYKQTKYDPDAQRAVAVEMKKIQCFNYIVDNILPHSKTLEKSTNEECSLADSYGHTKDLSPRNTCQNDIHRSKLTNQQAAPVIRSHDYDITTGFKLVQEVLQKSRQTLKDIDSILKRKDNM